MNYTVSNIYPIEQAGFESENNTYLDEPQTSSLFFNRELSLIEFFRRVLEEGLDETQPLLERLKFLSIFASNLDEFFMIRVSSLKEKQSHKTEAAAGEIPVAELLSEIKNRLTKMIDEQMNCLHQDILPKLANQGINVVSYDSLADEERAAVNEYFKHKIYATLTPQVVDPSHPFPYIPGCSLNLGLMIKPILNRRIEKALHKGDEKLFARIQVPDFLSRFVPVEGAEEKFILIEDLIRANVQQLIPEAEPADCQYFRVTRDADIELREEEAADLMQTMEQNLKQQRFGDVVRIEVSDNMHGEVISYLTKSLGITDEDVYLINGALNIAGFMFLYKSDRPELKDEPLRLFDDSILHKGESTFEAIKRRDILLHHPYNPYSIVTEFLREAVEDPDVLAIKMCLYRTGANSPIPPLLIEAAERGKQVTVLVELKARFDEENNIEWAKRLEHAGVNVVYGLLGLKTHCKTTLIVRRENDELRSYVHLATGNYNPETSAFYTDLGLLTDDEEIGADSAELFNFLTAYSQNDNYRKFLVAPINLREKLVALIQRETRHAEIGKPAQITAKMNRLADREIIQKLYEASQAGVKIELIVRGVCMLRPGIDGLSENITVRSIVGRLLEHSRVYYFANGGSEEVFIGSADWMPRNLDRRVEVLTPVDDLEIKKFLKDIVLASYLRDNVKARRLLSDGTYEKVSAGFDDELFSSQLSFQNNSNVINFDSKHRH